MLFRSNLRVGDFVLVDTERGPSLAEVMLLDYTVPRKGDRKLKPVIRKVHAKEIDKPLRWSEEEIHALALDKIKTYDLSMRLLKTEMQFGGNKIILYFTSPARVDFRQLVKELANELKTRLELKQIGARDETKLLGGLGICGREYCCSSFLREFIPVSIKMAKNQNLALNPQKVSGGCGRLLCCLTYENDVYSQLRRELPSKGSIVRLVDTGKECRIVKTDLFNQRLWVEDRDGEQKEVGLKDIEKLGPIKRGAQKQYADEDDDNDAEAAMDEYFKEETVPGGDGPMEYEYDN